MAPVPASTLSQITKLPLYHHSAQDTLSVIWESDRRQSPGQRAVKRVSVFLQVLPVPEF